MQLISFMKNKRAMTSNIALAKQGDKEAFLSLLAENELNIYRVAKGMLIEVQDIEDAIQNTIIKAYTNIRKLKQNEFFRTWLIRILINECNKIIKNNRKTLPLETIIEKVCEIAEIKNIDLTCTKNTCNRFHFQNIRSTIKYFMTKNSLLLLKSKIYFIGLLE